MLCYIVARYPFPDRVVCYTEKLCCLCYGIEFLPLRLMLILRMGLIIRMVISYCCCIKARILLVGQERYLKMSIWLLIFEYIVLAEWVEMSMLFW